MNRKNSVIGDNTEYSIPQASKFMKLTYQTVSKYLRKRRLKGIKRGPKKKWFVRGSEIKKLMKELNMV